MEDTTGTSTAPAACACGHPVTSHWEVAEPGGWRVGCGFLGCSCEFVSAPAPENVSRRNISAGPATPESVSCRNSFADPDAVNLAALMDALDHAARAAFGAECGQDAASVADDVLAAVTAARAAYPDGSDGFRCMCIVLGTIVLAAGVTA